MTTEKFHGRNRFMNTKELSVLVMNTKELTVLEKAHREVSLLEHAITFVSIAGQASQRMYHLKHVPENYRDALNSLDLQLTEASALLKRIETLGR